MMIIGIGGASRAGKTTLAEWIRKQFPHQKIQILCQDDYVFPTQLIPKINDRIDWEHPDSIDHEAFRKAIIAESKSNDLVIVEGLMVFYDQQTNALFDKALQVEIDFDTFLERKKHDHRWGHEPAWYLKHIWESHLKYGKIPEGLFAMKVDGTKNFQKAELLKFIDFKAKK
ncbi:MAG: hypothetical protein M0Q90_08035 [Bacteroidales bacterium]|nr:hypothetical protein [Bacteroidales bacterium]